MSEQKIDNVEPGAKWEFDENVADVFENMLERSIPQYEVMRDSVATLAHKATLVKPLKLSLSMLDIGCSDGLMIERLIDKFAQDKREGMSIIFNGIDISEPMLKKAKYRFLDEIIDRKVNIFEHDLRDGFPEGIYDVITSVLSIQFTPIEHRQNIIQNIYNHLSPTNGCFIMVEKILGNTAALNNMFVDTYYDMKRKNGYTQEQIDRKRLSLEGVLVPVTNDWNIELLKQAGFKQVDVFWRWMNFVGYIAIK